MTTGNLLSLTNSLNSATSTGNILKITNSGSSSTAVPLMITNAGTTGLSLRINRNGSDTDPKPTVIDAQGNVGIGVLSPSAPLTVAGNIVSNEGNLSLSKTSIDAISSNFYFYKARGGVAVAGGDAVGSIGFNEWTGAGYGISAQITSYADAPAAAGSTPGSLSFSTAPSGALIPVERLKIDSSGNVGVGTSSPISKLQISGGTLSITGNSGGTIHLANGYDTGSYGARLAAIDNGVNGHDFRIQNRTTATGAFTDSLAILSSGNVGIGTTGPTSTLNVVYDSNPNPFMYTAGISSHSTGIYGAAVTVESKDTGGRSYTIVSTGSGNYPGAGSFGIFDNTVNAASSYRFVISPSGNVGIGNYLPSQLLHVGSATTTAGTAVANFQTASGTCTMTPASAGSGMACSSDERLKKNILEISGDFALDRILRFQAVTYEFKKDPTDQRHTGYIAQKVKGIAPEFVRQNEDGFYQIYYDGLIPWITESIKSLYTRILGVEKGLSEQKRELATIKDSKADKSEAEALRLKLQQIETENKKLEKENAQIKIENQSIKNYLCRKDAKAPICK